MSRRLHLERRHFEFIAATIASLPDNVTKEEVQLAFRRACKATNPKFNGERFYLACKIDGEQNA